MLARIVFAVVKIGVEGAVRELTADVLDGRHVFREQVDGTPEGRGPNGGGGPGAAVEVDAAEELRGEEGP